MEGKASVRPRSALVLDEVYQPPDGIEVNVKSTKGRILQMSHLYQEGESKVVFGLRTSNK